MGRNAQWDTLGLTTEQRVQALAADVDAHHKEDVRRFAALHDRFDRLDAKVDARLSQIAGRATGAIIGVMSGIIVALAVALVTLR